MDLLYWNISNFVVLVTSLFQLNFIVASCFDKFPAEEKLVLTPLPTNYLLASFMFELDSHSIKKIELDEITNDSNYQAFPKVLGPIFESTNVTELHLKFARGYWDAEKWGKLPNNGEFSGGTGVELWSTIDANSEEEAFAQWEILVNYLSGLFCASMNFIDKTTTTYPQKLFEDTSKYENRYLLRSVLPKEPVCTENLTPFLRLLPTKGKAGISSLLDGHQLFYSPWHSMSIDIKPKLNSSKGELHMSQHIDQLINIPSTFEYFRSPIPKPVSGDALRCDDNKRHDLYYCFPKESINNLSYELKDLFGKEIENRLLIGKGKSEICFDSTEEWKISGVTETIEGISINKEPPFDINLSDKFNVKIETSQSGKVKKIDYPNIFVSRSFTGYREDSGGIRIVFKNPSLERAVRLVYFESLPWYMRIYLHTLELIERLENLIIKEVYFQPSVDRKRPGQIELELIIPPNSIISMNYKFDKSLLLYSEYPPDANHGFELDPSVVKVIGDSSRSEKDYFFRTTSLLLSLPTPDFSMPYNVIIFTSTVMALTYGTIFNLLIKRLINEEETEGNSKNNILKRLKQKFLVKLKSTIQKNKSQQ
ncbi:GPI-anchor transamidase subunit GPI16 [Ascoidea rubescens DSM 1968]|uniref:Transmembrane protein subunit of the glycosylphosphatidylinositol transamidase complex n=1 Tax=Ascoidea rubescens DSM 1968 TaxID=1344418 RepID=A0A1D2VDG9_9ASCO|nr:transmembrane protein subunit of the glycosylphosphatidylinositol transamidase complex [Ascoidea rubescens DSM 1968]ODV59507.1 transmembrane protein subunit of the glycosylphosphatidylinositol transamidase complex [Ascoidea rubescens DSM 1968]